MDRRLVKVLPCRLLVSSLGGVLMFFVPVDVVKASIQSEDRSHLTTWLEPVSTTDRTGTGDAAKSWTLASGLPLTSVAINWSPNAAPAAGEDALFGTLKAGNYLVQHSIYTPLGVVTVDRALATEQAEFTGEPLNAAAWRIANGRVFATARSFSVTAPGTSAADSSIVVGSGVGKNGTLTLSGTIGRYVDARVGVGGATGSLNIIGVTTSLKPQVADVTESVFGGAADAGTANILIDAATVDAWVITTGKQGLTRFTNNAIVHSRPAASGVGQIQIGSPDLSNVTFEVSNGADLRLNGADGAILVGAGASATTTTNVLSGGAVVADLLITGAQSTNGLASSTNTINVSGTGSTITTTDAFNTNGGYRFTNIQRGASTVNVTAGGKIFTPRYDANAMDRTSNLGAASTTSLTIDGFGSRFQARTDTGGAFVGSLGDYTSDVTVVRNYGMLDAGQIAVGVGAGGASTLIATDYGVVSAGLVEIARPFAAGAATTGTLTLTESATMNVEDLITASSLSSIANITVSNPLTSLQGTGVAILGGASGNALGGGNTNFTVNDGASVRFVALSASGTSAVGASGSYTGTQITVSGAGTSLQLTGRGSDTPATGDLASNLLLGGAASTRASLTILNGGTVALLDNQTNANKNGSITMSAASSANASILVDGATSTLDAGQLISMVEAPTANAFINATAFITVRNGGFLAVYENPETSSTGNLQMGIRPSTGSTATLTIGGGTALDDSDSLVAIDGTLFVGGSGDAIAPLAGARSTVNLNNGSLSAAAIAVYANSVVNHTGGNLTTDNLSILGGRVNLSPSVSLAPELGEVRFAAGGMMNVGKGGAVVYYSTASGSGSDLSVIRQAIIYGYAGGTWTGTNAITSSLLSSSTTHFGIGYADIDAANISSFLGVDFSPAAEAVVFRYTLRGDTNLDGRVNFDDLLVLAQNYGVTNSGEWYLGDFNYSRSITFDDLLILAQNYGQAMLANGVVTDAAVASRFQSDWALAQSIVPEPTMLLLPAGLALFARRSRR